MIKGVGVDICDNSRFSSPSISFLKKIFTSREIEEMEKRIDKACFLSSRFALKEAVAKALGTGFSGLSPLDIECKCDELGRPYVLIRGERRGDFHISLSHEKEYSIALALWEEV